MAAGGDGGWTRELHVGEVKMMAAKWQHMLLGIEPDAGEATLIEMADLASELHSKGMLFFHIEGPLRIHCEQFNRSKPDSKPELEFERLLSRIKDRCTMVNRAALVADPSVGLASTVPQAILKPLCMPIVLGTIKSKPTAERNVGNAHREAFSQTWDLVLKPIREANTASRAADSPANDNLPQWKLDLLARKKAKAEGDAGGEPKSAPAGSAAAATLAPSAAPEPSRTLSGSVDGVSPASIEHGKVPWGSAVAIKLMAGGLGSSGVVMIVMQPEGAERVAAVVKPGHPANLVAEAFGTRILRAFGLEAPQARAVPLDERSEIGRVLSKTSLYDRAEDRTLPFVHFHKGGQMWLLSEFVPAAKIYAYEGSLPDPPKVLHQLGRLAVVDAILNNYDRIPAAHVNAGNVENVLVSSTGVVHPIDQTVAVIKVEAGQKMHVDRIKALAAEANGGVAGKSCERVSKHLAEAGVNIPDSLWPEFLAGVRDGIAKAKELGPEFVQQARQDVEVEFREAGAMEQWLQMQLEGISVDFVQRCMAGFTD